MQKSGRAGLTAGEGAFLLCTFWLADALILLGRRPQAQALFERVLAVRNDLDLLSESYNLIKRRLLGNFPQALSLLGLINTARNLADPVAPARERSEKTSGNASASPLWACRNGRSGDPPKTSQRSRFGFSLVAHAARLSGVSLRSGNLAIGQTPARVSR